MTISNQRIHLNLGFIQVLGDMCMFNELQVDKQEEEKEEVKLINGIINPPPSIPSNIEDEILPEFENLLSGENDFLLPSEKYDTAASSKAERDRIYENDMANNNSELERLLNIVTELEER